MKNKTKSDKPSIKSKPSAQRKKRTMGLLKGRFKQLVPGDIFNLRSEPFECEPEVSECCAYLKKFFLFAYDEYHAHGGVYDFAGRFSTIGELNKFIRSEVKKNDNTALIRIYDTIQIVKMDYSGMKIILSDISAMDYLEKKSLKKSVRSDENKAEVNARKNLLKKFKKAVSL